MNPTEPDDELLHRLRAADPAASLGPVPPDRVDRLLEVAMSTDTDTRTTTREDGTHNRNPLTWLVAAAAVVLIVGAGLVAVLGTGDDNPPPTAGAPTVTTLGAPTATSGRCMVPNAQTLSQADVAFDGTVVAIGDQVTLEVTRWYTAQDFDRVRVTATPDRLRDLIGAADFQVGDRYLVAGNDSGRLMVCGFTGPWSERLAKLYGTAFAS